MSDEKITIICKRVKYFSQIDEDMFFYGLEKISCIEGMGGVYDELHLYLSSLTVSRYDYRGLKGLFRRYKIKNIEQLEALIIKDEDEGDPDAE